MPDERKIILLRNLTSSFAFFLLFVIAVISVAYSYFQTTYPYILIISIDLLIGACGILLLVFRKRDFTAISMIIYSMYFTYSAAAGNILYSASSSIILVFFIIMPLMLIFTRENKSLLYIFVFLPYGIGALYSVMIGVSSNITHLLYILFGILALCLSVLYLINDEKWLPSVFLRSDEEFSFKKGGPALVYLCVMVPFSIYAVDYSYGKALISDLKPLLFICSLFLIIISVLLLVFSKPYFKAILSATLGIFLMVMLFVDSSMFFISGGIYMFLGVLCLLQKEGKAMDFLIFFMPGLMIFLLSNGIQYVFMNMVLGGIPVLLSIYVALTYLLQKQHLPKF